MNNHILQELAEMIGRILARRWLQEQRSKREEQQFPPRSTNAIAGAATRESPANQAGEEETSSS